MVPLLGVDELRVWDSSRQFRRELCKVILCMCTVWAISNSLLYLYDTDDTDSPDCIIVSHCSQGFMDWFYLVVYTVHMYTYSTLLCRCHKAQQNDIL